MINLGTCPNTDCNTPLTADETAATVKCRGCKNTWNTNYLRNLMNQKILESEYTGTMRQIINLLAQSTGQIVNANTFKTSGWNPRPPHIPHRGRISAPDPAPTGRTDNRQHLATALH